MTLYCDYAFEINESGLKLTDTAEPDEFHQVQIKNTPLNVGDTFTLELDEDNCMFFKKIGPVQLNLEI